jgi:hypothetical protein
MSSRVLFGVGAIGEPIKRLQQKLTDAGFNASANDGWYSQRTSSALQSFQRSASLPPTGVIDEATWQLLMQCPLPSVRERSLHLTAAFEGHGFGLAVGNFDGALLTWGIIGFTLQSGEIQRILQALHQTSPHIIQQSFQTHADELLTLITSAPDIQKNWADQHTLPNGSLSQPWREMFSEFGSYPEVQAEQMKHVWADYMAPAIVTAKKLTFASELGLALCFDIHVQNGGIKRAAAQQIRQNSTAGMSESDLRIVVANAVADNARVAYREDVRSRKMTLATGRGIVHGHTYVLENWGLSDSCTVAELVESTAHAAYG